MSNQIPYKIYLEESEMPQAWYNVRADMKNKPAPLLNPGTHQPMTAEELGGVFCDELVQQELDNETQYIEIPKLYTSNVTWDPQHYRLVQDSEPLDLNKGTASLHHTELVCPSCRGGHV